MKSITIFCLLASALAELSSTFVRHGHDASKLAQLNTNSRSLLQKQDVEEQVPRGKTTTTTTTLREKMVPLGETTTTTPREKLPCKHHEYQVHIFSSSPIVMYLSGFLTEFECSYLMNISESTAFMRSGVATFGGHKIVRNMRSSESALLNADDDVVRCIEERAAEFQGLDMPMDQLELLQMVRYGTGGHYTWHTDWFPQPHESTADKGGHRKASIFLYVGVGPGTLGGGTNFPHLDAPADRRWCDRGYIDCDKEWEAGITFSPMPGNGIYWENLANDGSRRGDYRLLHAGLPVLRGTKMGMNIWTREDRLPDYIINHGRRY